MKKLILLCGALTLFSCTSSMDEGPPAEPEGEGELDSAVGGCCIDYTCVPLDFTTTGCRLGAGPSIREAFEACNDVCGPQCLSSGLYCD